MICWSCFSWEAFTTLVAAGVAGGAATWVGLAQVRIADRQRQILERQARLAKLSVSSALFERRFAVYIAARDWLLDVVLTGEAPDGDRMSDMVRAVQAAQFLFDKVVVDALEGFLEAGRQLEAVQHLPRREKVNDASHDREEALQNQLELGWSTLPGLFGDTLRIAERL